MHFILIFAKNNTMRKILISILFAIIASMLCHAQDDSIFYLMPNEEPIIKKHIDRLDILNNRLNKLGINTEQKNIYFHITRDANSESIYLRTSKSDILGDKSNRRLIVGDNSYPITFDFDYQYATFSPIDSIGSYGHRDDTYLQKRLIIEYSPIIYKQHKFTGIANIIISGDNGLNAIEPKFPEIKELDSLKYSTISDTIYVKIAHHDMQAISIKAWSSCDNIHIYDGSVPPYFDRYETIPLEQNLFDNWNKPSMPSIFESEKYKRSILPKNQNTYYQIIIRNGSASLSHFKF